MGEALEFDFEAYRQRKVIYSQNRRAKKMGVAGVLSEFALREALERQHWVCVYCETDLTVRTPTIDHIKPLAFGGENTDSNVHAVCLSCNSRKGQKTHEFCQQAFVHRRWIL
jgi:5-methylcytosine-specific restriction protein A